MAGMNELAELVRGLEEQLVICIRCGMCQAVCPLFEQTKKEADVARGKLALLDGLMKNLFFHVDGVKERLNRCLLCGSCAANCPSGVNIMEIFIKARAILTEYEGLSPVKKIIFRKMLAKPATFDRIGHWAGRLEKIFTKDDVNIQNTSSAKLISPLIAQRHFIPLAEKPLHAFLFPIDSSSDINISHGRSGLKIGFFTGCLIDKIYPGIGRACLDVLDYHGIGVYLPKNQGCCGMPALAYGDMASFEMLVEHHIKLFERENFDYLVTACATCTSTIKKLWPVLYRGRNSGFKKYIKELSDKTLDINEFLINNCPSAEKLNAEMAGKDTRIEDKGKSFQDEPAHDNVCAENKKDVSVHVDERVITGGKEIVTYHDPCHLKKTLGVADEPRQLIKASRYELREMVNPDKCCGMGGSFNLFHYDLSLKIGYLKQKEIADTHCSIVATGCPACMMQISDMLAKNNLKIKVKHPVELYADSIKS